jgi:hypothetical protein
MWQQDPNAGRRLSYQSYMWRILKPKLKVLSRGLDAAIRGCGGALHGGFYVASWILMWQRDPNVAARP